MFVKICGLKTPGDVACAVGAGADAVGFLLAPSVRQVSPQLAAELGAAVPDDVLTVGVFTSLDLAQVRHDAVAAGVRAIQLHGNYPLSAFEELADLGLPLIRAVPFVPGTTYTVGEYGESLLLLDSAVAGSGDSWDHAALNGQVKGDWLLAGGLDPESVGAAIAATSPFGVDVSSGVESSRGIKDHAKIEAFIAAAHSASH